MVGRKIYLYLQCERQQSHSQKKSKYNGESHKQQDKTMNKTIEIAGKSYEVESYSDEHKIYVEAGSLMHVVTSDNAEEVVADLVDIAGGHSIRKCT